MSDKFLFSRIDGSHTAVPGASKNTPSTVSVNSSYHKRRHERLFYDLIFDAFIAPVIAAFRAFTTLFLNVILLFGLAYGSTNCLSRLSEVLDLDDLYSSYHYDITLVFGTLGTSLVLFFYCWLITQHPSKLFGAFNGATASLFGALGLYWKYETPNSIGLFVATGACLSALIYWIWIEPEQITLSSILSHHYGQVSNLRQSSTYQSSHNSNNNANNNTIKKMD